MITKSQIKFIQSLSLKKNRIKHRSFIVEGEKNVEELLKSNFEISALYAIPSWKFHCTTVKTCLITNKDLGRISQLINPNKVLAVVKIPDLGTLNDSGVVLVLDSISDPGNLGTIIRLCDWFGIREIICSSETVDTYNHKVVQSSMGSIFRVKIRSKELVDYLSTARTPIYAASLEGNSINDVKFPKDMHLVLGNESCGISDKIKGFIKSNIKIDKAGNEIDSLNVAMSAAIFLYKIRS